MKTYLIDPRNTTKPYNFGLLTSLKKKRYPFEFLGFIPESWKKHSSFRSNSFYLPLSRNIFENKRVQRFIANFTQTAEIFFGHLHLRSLIKERSIIHFLWFTSPSIEQHIIPHLSKSSLIHTAHNLFPHREKSGDIEKFIKLYSHMDFISVHDYESLYSLKEKFDLKTPIRVIPHGNLEHFYNTFDTTTEHESEIFWNKTLGKIERPVFLFMGPIKKYKGFNTLSKAVSILNSKGHKFSLVVKDKKNIEMENIHYLHRELPYSKLGLFYRNADIIILPHTKISQSVTLFEAGYFKKAVIVSSVGGFKETVRNEIDGLHFRSGDSKSLSEKMEIFINSPDKFIKSMGINFKENLINNYSWNDIVELWIEIYESNLCL